MFARGTVCIEKRLWSPTGLSPNCVEYTPFGATHLTGEIALMPRGRPRSGARPCGAGGSCSTPCFSRSCCVRWCRRAAPVSPGCTPFRRCPAAWLRGAPRSGGRGPASSSGRRRALRHERGRGGAVRQRAIVGSGCCAASNLQKVWPGWVVGYCRAPVWCDFEVLSCAFGDRCPSAHHLWNTLSSSEKAVRS